MAIHDLNLALKYTDWILMVNGCRIFAPEDSAFVHMVENIRSTRPINSSINRCVHDICAM
ncbi:MAG: hypothetical protein K8R06_10930 [Methanosarcinales archaeon]|nr:hypothetical protein [Methanosarcinales archaeon]MCD4808903.1 hypothetical protein [Methanosarcinales archaeon]MCD4816895.1 hypothetical protein [Methanosarcinales archaeon]